MHPFKSKQKAYVSMCLKITLNNKNNTNNYGCVRRGESGYSLQSFL